jgi:hypothetical protein
MKETRQALFGSRLPKPVLVQQAQPPTSESLRLIYGSERYSEGMRSTETSSARSVFQRLQNGTSGGRRAR